MKAKEAFQRRIQEKLAPNKYKSPPDHSTVIGSIRTGNINYQPHENFFDNSMTLPKALPARQYIKQFKDPDYMELKDKPWNISVSVPKKFEEEQSRKSKLLKIKLGFMDFSPVKSRPNKIYQGTEQRDNYQGWNVSTFVEKRDRDLGYLCTNANSLKNTVNYNSKRMRSYQTLQNRYNQSLQMKKSQLMNSSDIIEELKSSFQFFNPSSSPQKTHAVAMKMYDETKREQMKLSLSNMGTQDSFTNFKAKLSPTQKMNIKATHFHTGTWEKQIKKQKQQGGQQCSEGQEEDYAWSCCLSSEKDGLGCSKKIEDRNKMNLVSYNS